MQEIPSQMAQGETHSELILLEIYLGERQYDPLKDPSLSAIMDRFSRRMRAIKEAKVGYIPYARPATTFPYICQYFPYECVRKWYGRYRETINSHPEFDIALLHAAIRGDANTIVWLIEECDADITFGETRCVEMAALGGVINAVELLRDRYEINLNDHATRLFASACEGGHLDMIDWVEANVDSVSDAAKYDGFRRACTHGHIDVCERLVTEEILEEIGEKCFIAANSGSDGSVAGWLVSQGVTPSETTINSAFLNACRFNRVDALIGLMSEYKNLDERSGYRVACETCSVDVMVLLFPLVAEQDPEGQMFVRLV